MTHRGHRLSATIVALSATSLVLALGLFAQPVAAVATSITLTPSVGPPTTTVTVDGTGFGASETVAVNFDATQVATTSTSSLGTFSTTFGVPASALPGNHAVSATGQTSGLSATGSFLVRTDWPKFSFDLANSAYNPYENVVGPSNVAGLKSAWTGTTGSTIYTSPAVANGVVFVASQDGKLYAFTAAGCAGVPTTCSPLWTASIGGYGSYSHPAVANGVVYVGSFIADKLYAFSADGTTGCSGTPKTCTPLWTTNVGASPAVANGVVYASSTHGKLYAFSADGTTGCSGTPKTCTPLWTGAAGPSGGTPAVANGVVYMGSADYNLYAFSAAGTTGCSGTPKTCSPLWTGSTGNSAGSPSVANGVVYLANASFSLYAFSADGTTGCSGTPKTCTPLWTAFEYGIPYSSPAVANGVVYVGLNQLYAFSAAGTTGCSGTPKTCSPLWTAATGGAAHGVAVANGVVYVGDDKLYAFSAGGTTGCAGTPTTCSPLWTGGGVGASGGPSVVNGMVYFGGADGTLYAFAENSASLVPPPPTNVAALAGEASATVYWTPPTPFTPPVTGYVVTASPGGATVNAGPNATSATVNGLIDGTAYTFTVASTNANGTGTPSLPSNSVTPGRGQFHSLPPARILDTRDGTGGVPIAPLGQGGSLDAQITGLGGVPTSGVSAVVLNVTVTGTTAGSYLTVWPTGVPRPNASNLNWTAGRTVPNLVEVAVGVGGKVSVYNAAGSTDVLFDVAGYVATPVEPPGPDGLYTPVVPSRVLDTRDGTGGVPAAPVNAGGIVSVQVNGHAGLPATGVAAVVLNVTVTGPTAPSFLTVFPGGTTRPNASNLNFVAGQTVPNRVIVKVGSLNSTPGWVSFYNPAGSTHVIADIGGWFSDATNLAATGSRFVGVTPARILDTRNGTGGFSTPLGQGQTIAATVAGVGGVPAMNAAIPPSAVVLNVTVTNTTAGSFLTVWPDGATRPNASDLNWVSGLTVPNLVVVKVGTGGKIDLYNPAGSTDVIIDVVGWYG